MKSPQVYLFFTLSISTHLHAENSQISKHKESNSSPTSLFSKAPKDNTTLKDSIFDNKLTSKNNRFNRLWNQAKQYHEGATKTKSSSFIIGGRKASNEEFPSVVALVDELGRTFCSGNLIAPNIVATAGHCVLNLFQKTSADFKTLKAQLPLEQPVNLEQLTNNINQVVESNHANIHVRVAGKNYFDVVDSVATSLSWTEWNADIANYYLTGKRKIRHSSNSVSDKAIIRLNRSFHELDIPKIVNKRELEAIKQHQYTQAVQVGFGYIKDPDLIEKAVKNQAQAKVQLQELMDKKYLVNLPVNTVFNTKQGIRVGIGKPGKGACYGDSGGPTFVQLKNGDWRYLASLSKSVSNRSLCGESDANAWNETASETKKQTTDIADVWVL